LKPPTGGLAILLGEVDAPEDCIEVPVGDNDAEVAVEVEVNLKQLARIMNGGQAEIIDLALINLQAVNGLDRKQRCL
jgi:hypothetical protein